MQTDARKSTPHSDSRRSEGCTAPPPWLGLVVAVAIIILALMAYALWR